MPFGGLLTVGLIGAGAGLGGALIQSHSTSKAVDAQTDAANKQLALQREVFNKQQENEAPWRNVGASAIGSLGGLLGLGGGGGGGGSLGQLTEPMQYDAPISPGQANFDRYSTQGGYIGKDVPMSEHMTNPYVQVDSSGYTAQQHGASPSQAIPMLLVRDPTGQVRQVPADKVAEAEQNGGTVVGRI